MRWRRDGRKVLTAPERTTWTPLSTATRSPPASAGGLYASGIPTPTVTPPRATSPGRKSGDSGSPSAWLTTGVRLSLRQDADVSTHRRPPGWRPLASDLRSPSENRQDADVSRGYRKWWCRSDRAARRPEKRAKNDSKIIEPVGGVGIFEFQFGCNRRLPVIRARLFFPLPPSPREFVRHASRTPSRFRRS
jgi:hypothetical protein